ncbi:hypothetical protein CYMTET_30672 [Cymbomonas tetramitiformis]|uniref:L domain-like protein n=1 Tax=Cymbomonas tetramitiformis TaxID=36881 RepID=A0AAE0FIG0_9CHLO|nr:hypothetical protein CYMTET_30672 [Cymbomonas tetramitiformis]
MGWVHFKKRGLRAETNESVRWSIAVPFSPYLLPALRLVVAVCSLSCTNGYTIHQHANYTLCAEKPDSCRALEISSDETSRGVLTGTLPSELGELTHITSIYLKGQLSGTLPTELGDVTALQHLWLADNNLSGSLPTELGRLYDLALL